MASGSPRTRHFIHTFDIDNYLNRFVPRSRLYLLPKPVSFWFGYRAPVADTSKPATPAASNLLVWLFAFLGGFIGISIIENVFLHLPILDGHQVPIVIASFGAAAILEYNTIESPLSQPRNLIFGHFFSAVIGVAITKGFLLLPPESFQAHRWLAGALAVGTASTVMSITKTVHPPAGATALLAASTDSFTQLGWWMCALVLLASCLMLASALLVNNLYKRFPLYWWTPVDLSKPKTEPDIVKVSEEKDIELGTDMSSNASTLDGVHRASLQKPEMGAGAPVETPASREAEELTIRIGVDRIVIPDWMTLSEFESEFLEGLQTKLRSRS